ncbi:MAG: carbamoyl-phosphate synthase (glutamine-hydrolyzing) large subunit [Patescibacteria group bacterium]
MRQRLSVRKVLVLGSGGLRIGQAGEFDYSGSQAVKVLKAEGIETVLVNPNIATVQTDDGLADRVYFQPLNVDTVKRVIRKEQPDALLLGFGGQTALNLGLELSRLGFLKRNNVRVLGTPVESIRVAEDRDLFKRALGKIRVKTPRSQAVRTVAEAVAAAKRLGYPVMVRSAFSLGGLGAGKVADAAALKAHARQALGRAGQILVEEYLLGWKEIEYEVVRDADGNAVTVCNMENFDPMGVHTGESIVVAPSQTLNNEEYHRLRRVSLAVAEHLGIVGECNVQFALDPRTGDYRVIELNPRLSRSSALASKATGYPLASVAAKLALGYRLHELRNAVTGRTSAFFEPALDYLVVKIPRWDTSKFKSADRTIGSEMKSVGEVMAIGRSFPEALQKAVRMLNIGTDGIECYPYPLPNQGREVRSPTDRRLFAIFKELYGGRSAPGIARSTGIDPWFLRQLERIVRQQRQLEQLPDGRPIPEAELVAAKRLGFSDRSIGRTLDVGAGAVRERRRKLGIVPRFKQIDTLAGEFAAETNYLYATYHGNEHDLSPSERRPTIVIGSGPYAIGSSVEFDWCAVNTVRTLRRLGESPVMINSNPETVSTDFDESDRLYFEELTEERIRDIAEFEEPAGVNVSVGGQIANNLAVPLQRAGHPILGTDPADIDRAENRRTFSALLGELGVDQPRWEEVTTLFRARAFAKQVGYPILVRPSYILSGAAMKVISNRRDLQRYLAEATMISPEHPVVISDFIKGAKELEIDGVADGGRVVLEAMSEHVENAGVHSGDATIVLPPQRLYLETIRRAKRICREIVRALRISGPFNIQFMARDNELMVIECNLRAARSFPFVSKVTNHNFIEAATKVLIGRWEREPYQTLDLDHVGVKSPQFSYHRLRGADPVAHVEMASTGEVACLGDSLEEAFLASWRATEQEVRGKRLLLSIDQLRREKLRDEVRMIADAGWKLFATPGTHEYLKELGIRSTCVHKIRSQKRPNISGTITDRKVDLIINIPRSASGKYGSDGFRIRRLAVDYNIPLQTNLQTAQLLLRCLAEREHHEPSVKSWQEYHAGQQPANGVTPELPLVIQPPVRS